MTFVCYAHGSKYIKCNGPHKVEHHREMAWYFFFLKSTIYYTRHDDSLCLQKELYMEYQYPNLFMQLPNTKNY